MMLRKACNGFTLVEVILGGLTLAIAAAALLGAFLGQLTLNEHARNLSLAIHDANRVIEQLRQQQPDACGGSSMPSADVAVTAAAAGGASWTTWDDWLADTASGGGGRSVPTADPDNEQLIVVTCEDRDGGQYCGSNQVGSEWRVAGSNTSFDPIRLTVAVCWRHRNRTIGECTWVAGNLSADSSDPNNNGVIDSPAMLTTLITCRG